MLDRSWLNMPSTYEGSPRSTSESSSGLENKKNRNNVKNQTEPIAERTMNDESIDGCCHQATFSLDLRRWDEGINNAQCSLTLRLNWHHGKPGQLSRTKIHSPCPWRWLRFVKHMFSLGFNVSKGITNFWPCHVFRLLCRQRWFAQKAASAVVQRKMSFPPSQKLACFSPVDLLGHNLENAPFARFFYGMCKRKPGNGSADWLRCLEEQEGFFKPTSKWNSLSSKPKKKLRDSSFCFEQSPSKTQVFSFFI